MIFAIAQFVPFTQFEQTYYWSNFDHCKSFYLFDCSLICWIIQLLRRLSGALFREDPRRSFFLEKVLEPSNPRSTKRQQWNDSIESFSEMLIEKKKFTENAYWECSLTKILDNEWEDNLQGSKRLNSVYELRRFEIYPKMAYSSQSIASKWFNRPNMENLNFQFRASWISNWASRLPFEIPLSTLFTEYRWQEIGDRLDCLLISKQRLQLTSEDQESSSNVAIECYTDSVYIC